MNLKLLLLYFLFFIDGTSYSQACSPQLLHTLKKLRIDQTEIGRFLTSDAHPVQKQIMFEMRFNRVMNQDELIRRYELIQKSRRVPEHLINSRVRLMSKDELALAATEPFDLLYIEVRLSDLRGKVGSFDLAGLAENIPEGMKFVYTDSIGIKKLRIPIHPLSSQNYLDELLKSLRKVGANPIVIPPGAIKVKAHFTSSRSLILVPVEGGVLDYDLAYSVKVSLDQSTALFKKDKTIEKGEWLRWAYMNSYVYNNRTKLANAPLDFQYDVSGFSLAGLAKGFDGGALRKIATGDQPYQKDKILIPAFSLIDTKLGYEVARVNGVAGLVAVDQFWQDNLVAPFARATASLRRDLKIQHNSPHSQNVLLEFDSDLKPTGRVVIRDFDMESEKENVTSVVLESGLNFVNSANELHIRPSGEVHYFGLAHGMEGKGELYGWIKYAQWRERYYQEFNREYFQLGQNADFDHYVIPSANSGYFTSSRLNPYSMLQIDKVRRPKSLEKALTAEELKVVQTKNAYALAKQSGRDVHLVLESVPDIHYTYVGTSRDKTKFSGPETLESFITRTNLGNHVRNIALHYTSLKGLDASGVTWNGGYFLGSTCNACDFSGVSFKETHFVNRTAFYNTRFQRADLSSIPWDDGAKSPLMGRSEYDLKTLFKAGESTEEKMYQAAKLGMLFNPDRPWTLEELEIVLKGKFSHDRLKFADLSKIDNETIKRLADQYSERKLLGLMNER